ncbi:hypothetical protein E2C01_003255 [Portunus trituberculatus]|uniref:Uncharacterized protein n=1 Tax=Portunus trituberculatus TaxID=210409 RepID=A0A5B7CNF5_PORTR|nr:hypothetical protein [Portunus trituberculatus]
MLGNDTTVPVSGGSSTGAMGLQSLQPQTLNCQPTLVRVMDSQALRQVTEGQATQPLDPRRDFFWGKGWGVRSPRRCKSTRFSSLVATREGHTDAFPSYWMLYSQTKEFVYRINRKLKEKACKDHFYPQIKRGRGQQMQLDLGDPSLGSLGNTTHAQPPLMAAQRLQEYGVILLLIFITTSLAYFPSGSDRRPCERVWQRAEAAPPPPVPARGEACT